MSQIVQAGPGLHVGDYVLAQTIDRGNVIDPMPKIIHGHKLKTIRVAGKEVVVGDELDKCRCNQLDVSWLKYAADAYQISNDYRDFTIVECPVIMANGFPNRNLDAFDFNEVTSWKPMLGRPMFRSFVGAPVHQNHQNDDPTKAKGVIFDATLNKLGGQWHIFLLKGFDRTKDSRLAKIVQQKNRVGHSMGALVERTICSLPFCKFESDGITTCEHIAGGSGKGQIIRKHLCYERLIDTNGIESSYVEDPASVTATSVLIGSL